MVLFNSTNSHTYILSRHQNLNSCPKVATLFRGLLQSFNLQSYGVVMLKRILHFSTKDYVVMKKYSCVLVWKDTCFQNNEGMLLFLEENCKEFSIITTTIAAVLQMIVEKDTVMIQMVNSLIAGQIFLRLHHHCYS